MSEALNVFFNTYWITIVVFVISGICAGCLVEVYKQSIFTSLEAKYKGDPNDLSKPCNQEKLAKIKTIKGGTAFAVAVLLVAFFLTCIWKSNLPKIGNAALLPIWYTCMFLIQLVSDLKSTKNLISRLLGNFIPELKTKKKKMKKVWVPVDEEEE